MHFGLEAHFSFLIDFSYAECIFFSTGSKYPGPGCCRYQVVHCSNLATVYSGARTECSACTCVALYLYSRPRTRCVAELCEVARAWSCVVATVCVLLDVSVSFSCQVWHLPVSAQLPCLAFHPRIPSPCRDWHFPVFISLAGWFLPGEPTRFIPLYRVAHGLSLFLSIRCVGAIPVWTT